MKSTNNEEKQQARFHLYILEQALDPLHRIKLNLGYVESDRAKRYGRTDTIAGKAYAARGQIEAIEKKVQEILDMIQREKR